MSLKSREKTTLFWLVITQILQEPIFVLYNFSVIILRKHFGVNAFLIGAFVSLKPVVSILSFYWSSYLTKRPGSLKSNFFWAKILGLSPFLFFPLFVHPLYFLFASVNYILFYRAAKPAWFEILRMNTTKARKKTAFGWAFALAYLEGMFLAWMFGRVLDDDQNGIWPYLFVLGSLIGFINLYFLYKLPMIFTEKAGESPKISLKQWLIHPWTHTKELMQRREDFAKFQWGFMLCGIGIMSIQPVLPFLMVDVLDISYVSFGLAHTSWKGICIVLSSPIWSYFLKKCSIFQVASWVFFFVGLFPLLLLFSPQNILWFYAAYVFYGIAQGGSHLIWNLSGPIFSGEEKSSSYTATNVMMIGIRGAFAPTLGALITRLYGPFVTLGFGCFFCWLGALYIFPQKERLFLRLES